MPPPPQGNGSAEPGEAWSGPWFRAWGARIGGVSAFGALVYAVGWWMGVVRTRFLGLPADLISPQDERTYEVVMLFPRWTALVIGALGSGYAWRSRLLPTALVCILLWRLRFWAVGRGARDSARIARGLGHLLTAAGVAAVVLLAVGVMQLAVALDRVHGVLLSDPAQRVAGLSASLQLWTVPGRSSLAALMCGLDRNDLACRGAALGSMVWAAAAMLLWAVALWRLLNRLAQRIRWPERALMWVGHVLLLGVVGFSLKALVEVHAIVYMPQLYPLVQQAPAATDRAAAAGPATPPLAYLGAGGGLYYLFDCRRGALLVLREPPSTGWIMQGDTDVLRSALVAAGPLARWSSEDVRSGDQVGDRGALGCWTGGLTGGASPAVPGQGGKGLSFPSDSARMEAGDTRGNNRVRVSDLTLRARVKLESPSKPNVPRGLIRMSSTAADATYLAWRIQPDRTDPTRANMVLEWGTIDARGDRPAASLTCGQFRAVAGDWHLLTATLRAPAGGTTMRAFVDGRELSGWLPAAARSAFGLDLNQIIVGTDGRHGVGGVLDDVEVWTTALGPEEMTTPKAAPPPGPVVSSGAPGTG